METEEEIALSKKPFSLVVSGQTLICIDQNPEIKKLFSRIILQSYSVICCWVSPRQKASIVQLVKSNLPHKRTLSIGDGANDLNMIIAADVGVGIWGLEGNQASRAADYSIGSFHVL